MRLLSGRASASPGLPDRRAGTAHQRREAASEIERKALASSRAPPA